MHRCESSPHKAYVRMDSDHHTENMFSQVPDLNCVASNDSVSPSKREKKKKKYTEHGDAVCLGIDMEPFLVDFSRSPKKEKYADNGDADTSGFSIKPYWDNSSNSPKKKKEKRTHASEDVAGLVTSAVADNLNSSPKKRKKEESEVSGCDELLISPKIKKEKDVGNGEACSEILNESYLGDLTFSGSPKKKKKTEKEEKDLEDGEALCSGNSMEPILDESTFSGSPKKKKKKKKQKRKEAYASEEKAVHSETVLQSFSDGANVSLKKKKKKNKKQKDRANESFESEDLLAEQMVGEGGGVDKESKESSQGRQSDRDVADRPSSELTPSVSTPKGHNHSDTDNRHAKKKKRKRCEIQVTGDENDMHTGVKTETSEDASHTENKKKVGVRRHEPPVTTGIQIDSVTSCYICQESVSGKKMYIQHLAEEHNKRSYHCPKCLKLLSSEILVQHHLEICCPFKDSDEHRFASFHCRVCPLSFSNSPNLSRHMRTEHKMGTAIQHKCRHCGRMFTTSVSVVRHQVKCEEGMLIKPREQTFECHLCGKMYASQQGRSYHIRTIHKNHVYDCVCGKEFRGSSLYYAHRKVCEQAQPTERSFEQT